MANICAGKAEALRLMGLGSRMMVEALRAAAGGVDRGQLTANDLTEVLEQAFSQRNQVDSAVVGAIGALDRAVSRVSDQRLTAGLCCATWLAQQCRLSPGQAHATPRPPAPLPAGHPPRLRAGGDLLPARLGGGPLGGDGGARRRGPL